MQSDWRREQRQHENCARLAGRLRGTGSLQAMATFTRPRSAHVRLPDDFGLGVAVTMAVVALLGLVLLVSLSLPSRGPVAEAPAPGGVIETPAQSPPPTIQ